MNSLLKRGRARLVVLALGGGLLALQGCDPTVRDTVLNGVGSAATSLAGTFIQALIESMQKSGDPNDTTTTVRADVEVAPEVFV
jgi:hypothetical protein